MVSTYVCDGFSLTENMNMVNSHFSLTENQHKILTQRFDFSLMKKLCWFSLIWSLLTNWEPTHDSHLWSLLSSHSSDGISLTNNMVNCRFSLTENLQRIHINVVSFYLRIGFSLIWKHGELSLRTKNLPRIFILLTTSLLCDGFSLADNLWWILTAHWEPAQASHLSGHI